jgi:hypothetical protein
MRVLSYCTCTILILSVLTLDGQSVGGSGSSPVVSSSTHTTTASNTASADPLQLFLSRPPESLTAYRAFRTLKASNKRFKKDGWMTVWTELDPKKGFSYEIVDEGGSGYIRNKVLRKMLEGERDAIATGQPGRVALSTANYRFSAVANDGQTAKLQIVPLRADTLLVNGTVTIEAGTGDLLSVEGRLAKNPSFWTNRVEVSRRYGRIAGVRVPLQVESTASVKIVGTSEFSMVYEYASINGSAVGQPQTTSRLSP